MKYHPLMMIAVVCLMMGVVAPTWGSPLDDQIASFSQSADSGGEAAVIKILKAGLDEHRSAEAMAAVQAWLNRNELTNPDDLFSAGLSAEYSGQPLQAIGYYQHLLQLPGLNDKVAGQAGDAICRLLINVAGDDDAAYAYMRKEGNRIHGYGQVARYDRWFLDQAETRKDLIAVCDRLKTIATGKAASLKRYQRDLQWLCSQFEQFNPQEPDVYEAAAQLAGLKQVPAVYRARLQWFATVMPYNQKLDELRSAKAPADPKLTDAPLAAAEQLLKVSPDQGPFLVAQGWGTDYRQGRSNDCARRFEIDARRKLDQLLAAVPKMSADRRDDLLAYPLAHGQIHFDADQVRKLVIQFPESFNTLAAEDVPLLDNQMTVEDARALAPSLARNRHVQAAIVRAIAESGSFEAGAIADAMMKSQAWRFEDAKPVIQTAWAASKSQNDKLQDMLKRYADAGDAYAQMQKRVGKSASSKDRLAAFDELLEDLLSGSPKIRGVLDLWDRLFNHAPADDTNKMLITLTSDVSGDREYLLARALSSAKFGAKWSVAWQYNPDWSYFKYNRGQLRQKASDFIRHLNDVIAGQMQAGHLSVVTFGAWVHLADERDAPTRKLIQSLVKSPAYAELPAEYREVAGDGNHFGYIAISPEQAAVEPQVVSRELLDLPADANDKVTDAALANVIARAAQAPEPVTIIGLQPVVDQKQWTDTTRRSMLSLFRDNAPMGDYPKSKDYGLLIERVARELRDAGNWGQIEPYAAGIWRCVANSVESRPQCVDTLVNFAEAALKAGANSAAICMASSGLASQAYRTVLSRTDGNWPELRARLQQVLGKASIEIGIIDIPVAKTDSAYPIFKSQSEFSLGNTASAWELYDKNANQFETVLRKLTVPYCLWLVDRNIQVGDTDRAEQLIKALTIWSRQIKGTFTIQQEGELQIAYADVAFKKGSLQTAKAWYQRVAEAQEYKGTELQYAAALKSVDVDRAAKDFTSAMNELDKLMQIHDDNLRSRVQYARAEVYFDQERFTDAYGEVQSVLRRVPNQSDALILMGKIQLKMRKLEDASEIELGVTRDQKMIVPGEPVKINLEDPSLNVSGLGAQIEVEVRAKSGDRETVMLRQLGDDKTRYRAEIPTQLGPPSPGDKVLQVLGRDEIRYGYSDRFKKRMRDLPPDPKVVITVASDARLGASAGAFPPAEKNERLNLDELGLSTAQKALGTRAVRPGNPIYIRVVDPDQSKTGEIDQVFVSLKAGSGDTIDHVPLKETGPYTGQFEAMVPTAKAQSIAYASESAPGRDANMTISAESYPGWAGEIGAEERDPTLTIDLNDNVKLGTMNVQCPDATQILTHFVVQTSMNGRKWETRARYPVDPAPWTGNPRITSFPTYNQGIPITALKDRQVPSDWRQKMDIASSRQAVPFQESIVPGLTLKGVQLASGGHPSYSVLMRFRAYFYQPTVAVRTFQLTGMPRDNGTQTVFLIDGQPADTDSDDPLTIKRELMPGLHEIEIWRQESRASLEKRKPVLMSDSASGDAIVPCPENMFDPATFPQAVQKTLPGVTKIAKADDQSSSFAVQFGANTHARLIRLAVVGYKGSAPAIHKITLSDQAGRKRLPVEADYKKLRSNQQLEVVPGDRISMQYLDDRVVTERRTSLHANLTVAYNTATIMASFINYKMTEAGRELDLESIRRFEYGNDVGIIINDPDMDQTSERDVLKFKIQASGGEQVELPAVETGEHTGIFMGKVFPVSGKPERESDIQVAPGGTLTATYRDMENLDPGVPTDRQATIEHAQYVQPQLAVFNTSGEPLKNPAASKSDDKSTDADQFGPEIVTPRYSVNYAYPEANQADGSATRAVVGASLRFDVIAPYLALSKSSKITAYLQTQAGRDAYKDAKKADQPFDIHVPGTLKLQVAPSRSTATIIPHGYLLGREASAPSSRVPLDEGRFAFSVPLVLGDVPSQSLALEDDASSKSSDEDQALAVRPGDRVYIGFAYKNPAGKLQWRTATATLHSDALMDVMDAEYRHAMTTVYVGAKVHVRLIALELDRTPDRDLATIQLKAQSGAAAPYQLRETKAHSGEFKGSFVLSYASSPVEGDLPSVVLHGFPIKYGDHVTITYGGDNLYPAQSAEVDVNTGADGNITPFTKRYGEDDSAMKTTFTLAECFFELAKQHQGMGDESLARRELGHADKLLSEVINSHDERDMAAHAEYLLANLTLEYADLSKNQATRDPMYHDSLDRFSKIVTDYPKSEFASKSQYKKALVYEKLGQLDIAIEEYVKLAYKYPNSDLIPDVMSRLGGYFQQQGLGYKARAEELEKATNDVEAQGKAIHLRELEKKQYIVAATVFSKLQVRFPANALAPLAGVRAGQNYMRAADYARAIEQFRGVIDNQQYDGATIRSQALFWAGISYERMGPDVRGAMQNAYEQYTGVTGEFPDSVWAKRARGRLADPAFAKIIEVEQQKRERMLEAFKEQQKKKRK